MNWTTAAEHPVAPWDTPGLPPRTMSERCARHKHCAYRDDEPERCPLCHAHVAKCNGEHGGAPLTGWGKGVVTSPKHPTLKVGQYNDPREAAKASQHAAQPQERSANDASKAAA